LAFRVTDVSMLPGGADRLLGFSLDSPVSGSKGNVHVAHMIGWAVGRETPARMLEVLQNDRVVRKVPIRGGRADVAAALGIEADVDCVFHALVNLIGLETHTRLTLQVELETGQRVPACTVTLDRDPLTTGYEPALAPLMVTTLGRSGSTWLMQILASHPEVVLFRRFPYESAPAKYWIHMLRLLTEPVNLAESAYPDTFHQQRWWLGANPFHDERVYEQASLEAWFAGTHVESLALFTQRTIDDWYLTLARTQDQRTPAYFAEKHVRPNYIPRLTWELYPRAREIFLVRDFRDMARSILDFDARRGFSGFGRPEGITDEQYLRGDLRDMARDLMQSWQGRRERAHLVRYEDLVARPREVVAGLLDYLGVDASEPTVEHVLAHGAEEVLSLPGMSYEAAEIAAHRTVADLEATVGRWRQEPDGAVASLGEEVFGEPLAEFGYLR
jgi:Sulfotransferase family